MANVGPTYWYGGSVQWTAVAPWAALTAYAAGTVVRQLATPTVGDERVFVCIVAGTSLASEPTWVITKGAKTAETAGPTWQECTGQPGVNGDITHSPTWTQNKNQVLTIGQIIYTAGTASLQIVSTAGQAGNSSEPSFSATAGTTTADNTVTWTSLGPASNFGVFAAPFPRMKSMADNSWLSAFPQGTGLWADNHAETQSTGLTITFPKLTTMIAVDHTSGTPWTAPMNSLAASISTTGNSNINFAGTVLILNGFGLSVGSGAVNASITIGTSHRVTLKNCKLIKGGTTAGTVVTFPATSYTTLINTTWKPAVAGDTINAVGNVVWLDTPSWCDTSAATPTSAISVSALVNITLTNIDFSAFGGGTNLMWLFPASVCTAVLRGCKLAAGVTIANSSATGTTQEYSNQVFLINCDTAGSIARQEIAAFGAALTTETTIIRTGGASDGITSISWKITPNANNKWIMPFACFPRVKWNTTTGSSVTATMYGIWAGGAVPNNDDVWMEVRYFGDSGSPAYFMVTTGKSDILAAGSPTSTDTSAWGGSTTPFKMIASFTPQLAGYVEVTVYVANAATTVYIDPQIYLS